MGITISILSPKGGVGKSTLSILLPTALYHKKNLRVMVLDADAPQYSVIKKRERELRILASVPKRLERYETLYSERPPYPILPCKLEDCPSLIQKHKDQYDVIFVDMPRHVQTPEQHPFYKEINYFFIPLIPEELSIEASYEIYNFLQKKIMPHSDAFQKCMLVFNKVQTHHKLSSLRSLFKNIEIMEKVLPAYRYYEYNGRSTLFPMASSKKETKQFDDFLENFFEIIQPTSALSFFKELMFP